MISDLDGFCVFNHRTPPSPVREVIPQRHLVGSLSEDTKRFDSDSHWSGYPDTKHCTQSLHVLAILALLLLKYHKGTKELIAPEFSAAQGSRKPNVPFVLSPFAMAKVS